MVRSDSFLPEPTKIQSPKMEGKWGRRGGVDGNYPSTPSPPSHICNVDFFFFFTLLFFFFLHVWLYSTYPQLRFFPLIKYFFFIGNKRTIINE